MSRFTGWTEAALKKLNLEFTEIPISKPKCKKAYPDYPGMICQALKVLGIESVREYKFLHDRRFRFDIAIPEHKIAIEFDGGIFSQGRHTRGAGFASDAKKSNLAVMHGWKLFRYTTADTTTDMWEYKVAQEIKEGIEGK